MDSTRIARDYNRGLPAPVRWAHLFWATTLGPIWDWSLKRPGRFWVRTTILAFTLFLLTWPLDGPVKAALAAVHIGGDIRRELEALGQYGQFSVSLIVCILIWRLDPRQARRIWDFIFAALSTWLVVQSLKMLLGRPRPRMDLADPGTFLGPFGAWPFGPEVGVRHSWEIWADISSDLWSMPSSHTALAVVLTVFLARLYPRIAGVVWTLAIIVGVSRVVAGAHYVSDVAVGAVVAAGVAGRAIDVRWGSRVMGRNRESPPVGP